ncbi:homoserine O-acetyltransferase [Actinoplanes sp. SE50]|uniref:alpha/beta fold hydrolase n=1 Tax=unclassified Actinoplanes TaxID=2626549 RepID=UPI00023EC0D3|nr:MULTISPECIES: alpha/beta fold hydrolase [unclassified Actinoplanes]AEV84076.1 Homoserine O-acetyltransferase [Actinoplanes sp. SE50/110]ATO82468.1 homoserine O-acetyltransferase [Actinoplanes sp. SE50]SLL99875.1 homoserine O-acetyltransferase [Actinoplanes sp. SE50/110]
MHPQPPRRTTHAHGTPHNRLVYDRWGRFGRPVVLLHGLFYDRTMWWPVAAELDAGCAAVAVDLPGHGESAPRADLSRLTEDLAALIRGLDLHRAPILVAHAGAARLARAFAEKYAVQHVLTVDDGTDTDLSVVPAAYRQFAVPRRPDRAVTAAYREWAAVPVGAGHPASRAEGTFPHLRDPAAFAALLHNLV